MQSLPSPPMTPKSDEIDLRSVFAALRRAALPVLGAAALAGGGAYVLSARQAPVFEATAGVIATDNERGNTVINNTLVTAPLLPQGAVEQAMHSSVVLGEVTRLLGTSTLPPRLLSAIKTDLDAELASNTFNRFKVKARLDPQQRGVYEIRAQAETPQAARLLADAGVRALLAWDVNRAQQGVTRSRNSLQEQLRDLGERIAASPAGSLERQSLVSARGEVLQNLSQVAVLETAATGTLTLVTPPVAPRAPISPKPLRNGVLAGLLALFGAGGLALLLDALRRRVNGPEDLLPLGLPLLGQLPALRRRDLTGGLLDAGRSGRLYESLGFLRINVLSLLGERAHKSFAVSSAHPGEGKSSVTAALADSLAAGGLKVLILDADLRRPTQLKVWAPGQIELVPLPGSAPGAPPATTVGAAFLNPQGAHATRVARGVDLLPGGSGSRGAGLLNQPGFRTLLDRWSQGYDVVLIDTPPMLSLPDTLAVAPYTDGVLVVVEAGRTGLTDAQRTLQNARVAGVRVLGLVLNKIARSDSGYYGYYAPRRGGQTQRELVSHD